MGRRGSGLGIRVRGSDPLHRMWSYGLIYGGMRSDQYSVNNGYCRGLYEIIQISMAVAKVTGTSGVPFLLSL